MPWKGRDIISIEDFTWKDLRDFFAQTKYIKDHSEEFENVLKGYKMALLFFEDSTRTRISFHEAMKDAGGRIRLEVTPKGSSIIKGEKIHGNVRNAENYGSHIIVIRHPADGSAQYAADLAKIPVINGGDGYNEHPTQNLMDLYTIHERKGTLDGLKFLFFGDLKYGRATRIMLPLSQREGNEFYFLSHEHVKTPDSVKSLLKKRGCKVEELTDPGKFAELLMDADIDVAYGSRIQKERFPETAEDQKKLDEVRNSGAVLTKRILEYARPKGDLIVMHPLPFDENYPCITWDVEDTPYAYWDPQMANGIPARRSMLYLILGGEG